MISTIDVMDFLHQFSSFVWSETSQIRVRVETGVGFLVYSVPEKYVPSGQVLELSWLCHVVEKYSFFQVGNDGVSPPG